MTRRSLGIVGGIALAVILLGLGTAASLAQTGKPAAKKTAEPVTRVPAPTPMPPGKPGGTLNVMLREDLSQGFAIHESPTISVVFPSSPCFNNLVMFDPANPVESPDSVVPELAERWSWQDCSEQVMKMIDQQSMELDPAKRLGLVIAVQKQLEQDAARPTLDQRLDYFTVWPHVKNMVPHHNIFNFGRMQNVWRDK
jgi:ABC-type transport system substrate-binding protein